MADSSSYSHRPKAHRRKNHRWTPDWPEGVGSSGHVVFIALCCRADDEGHCEESLARLAAFACVTVQTARMAIGKLINSNALSLEKTGRDGDGMFGTNAYILALNNPRVRDLFERFRRIATSDNQQQEIDIGTDSGGGELVEPVQNSTNGPYKDTRAGARASKSFILHSLPDDHGIDDDTLAGQVAQVLKICGRGTAGVNTQGLADSLAYNIPRALEKGFSFEKDILPCIRHYTRVERRKPLDRFDVTFRVDLPEWRAVRLRRKEKQRREDSRGAKSVSGFASEYGMPVAGNLLDRAIQARENLTDDQRRATRLVALQQRIDTFDSGEEAKLRGLIFELPSELRDLYGEALIHALRPIIEVYRLEMNTLRADIGLA